MLFCESSAHECLMCRNYLKIRLHNNTTTLTNPNDGIKIFVSGITKYEYLQIITISIKPFP